MARPRVFISSTFYDLKQVRADLERFIRDFNYEPVLHEAGSIPYGIEERLEEYCYREIEMCDIVIAIIGGKFGSSSQHEPHSITQKEINKALEDDKQIYVFIDKNVKGEYETYCENKENGAVRYRYVSDVRVYMYLDELGQIPINNQTYSFETSDDIIRILKEQWAGLFQRYLQEQSHEKEAKALRDITGAAKTLYELVQLIRNEYDHRDQAINDILLSNHPAMEQIKDLLKSKYRVYFTTRQELSDWLKYARSFSPVPSSDWLDEEYEEWSKMSDSKGEQKWLLRIKSSIFQEDGHLRPIGGDEWDYGNIKYEKYDRPLIGIPETDDDPFADV